MSNFNLRVGGGGYGESYYVNNSPLQNIKSKVQEKTKAAGQKLQQISSKLIDKAKNFHFRAKISNGNGGKVSSTFTQTIGQSDAKPANNSKADSARNGEAATFSGTFQKSQDGVTVTFSGLDPGRVNLVIKDAPGGAAKPGQTVTGSTTQEGITFNVSGPSGKIVDIIISGPQTHKTKTQTKIKSLVQRSMSRVRSGSVKSTVPARAAEAAPAATPEDRAKAKETGKSLGLIQDNELEAFADLVLAPPNEKENKLKQLTKLNSAIAGKVSVSKSGNKRVHVHLKSSPLGQGGFKTCFAAIRIGGKAASKTKREANLSKRASGKNSDFKSMEETAAKRSEQLHRVAGEDRGLFLKYKKHVPGEQIRAQLIEGGDFLDQLDKCSQNADFRTQSMQRLLKGCLIMEQNGIVHGDLKEENLLLSEDGLIFSDYDMMKNANVSTPHVSGTPGYIPPELTGGKMPPEQQKVEARKHDQFSAGMIMLNMCCGPANSGQTAGDQLFSTNNPNHISETKLKVLLRELGNIQPPCPTVTVLIGLLQPEAANRMSFAEASRIMERGWEVSNDVLDKIGYAVQDAGEVRY